jgi:hypothetical protein
MTSLMDAVRIEAPKRSPVKPAAPLDPPRDSASESRLPESSFGVESRGGSLTQSDQLAMGRERPLWREAA